MARKLYLSQRLDRRNNLSSGGMKCVSVSVYICFVCPGILYVHNVYVYCVYYVVHGIELCKSFNEFHNCFTENWNNARSTDYELLQRRICIL